MIFNALRTISDFPFFTYIYLSIGIHLPEYLILRKDSTTTGTIFVVWCIELPILPGNHLTLKELLTSIQAKPCDGGMMYYPP